MLLRLSEKLGPIGPSFIFFLVCAYGFFINRVFLSIYHWENTTQLDSILPLFLVGLRTDAIIICLSLIVPTLLNFLLNNPQKIVLRLLFSIYFSLLIIFFLMNEIATWPFMAEFSSRPNQLSFQYLTHPKEVFFMLWADYQWLMLSTAIFLALIFRASFYFFNACIDSIEQWKLSTRLTILPLILILLALGARSGIGEATANPSLAAFSNNFISNQIALNASYSLTHAFYRTQTASMLASELYGDMPADEVITRVKKYMNVNERDFLSKNSTYHAVKSSHNNETPKNLVIIIIEGLSAKYVGHLNGGHLTPNLDAISKESIVFSNLHAIGTRTDRGVQAMTSGFPATSGSSSILRMDGAQNDFFTISNLLKPLGYNTSFIYGGEKHFDNMASFFLGNGVDTVIGQSDYENPSFQATWGVSDEDTLAKTLEVINKQSNALFVSITLTLSNHKPHDFPQGKIELATNNINSVENTVKYTDYALGEFFKKIKGEPYYSDTIFLITADHPYKHSSTQPVPVDEFRIPGLLFNSGLPAKKIDTLASQLDLLPTVIPLLGHDLRHPMIGKNLLARIPKSKLANIMIFQDIFVFRTNNTAVLYPPEKKPLTYKLIQDEWIESPVDEEVIKDGLAHILFPSVAFKNNLYESTP